VYFLTVRGVTDDKADRAERRRDRFE
jgi:hypothetical protein